MSSFMFPPCIAGGTIFLHIFAHLYGHVEHVEIMQSCFQALRSPDKISGQNVETIVSKPIAFKLECLQICNEIITRYYAILH